ncbi:hypothetical protein E2562_033795 [Oryza meyeriana var. granulata]|uniref:Uncharacterized protein n=1 Tax=Oryza meyeriana var. granulata TaxID=110450 RepID=A0A6G1C1X2_9ORYZ|nr:hypothetical protein E2562_033795 [Oryza meyeriana var. granulata]
MRSPPLYRFARATRDPHGTRTKGSSRPGCRARHAALLDSGTRHATLPSARAGPVGALQPAVHPAARRTRRAVK